MSSAGLYRPTVVTKTHSHRSQSICGTLRRVWRNLSALYIKTLAERENSLV